jgi:ribosomal protein S18 acetylase RimI-like enzyme
LASVKVRPAEQGDIAQLVNLQFEVYPPPDFPPVNRWGASQLEAHHEVFPEGQLVAEDEGRVVGSATTMITTRDRCERPHSFHQITGGSRLSAHDPEGDALYGVDILVSPYFRGQGVARALYDARFALQERLELPSFYAGARIPGYAPLADTMSAEQYVDEVVRGEREDPTLSAQLHLGFEPVLVLPDYMKDPETKDYAVLVRRRLPEAASSSLRVAS